MKLVALAFGVSPSGREIIKSIGKNIFQQEIEIVDVKTTVPTINYSTDRVFCFGARALKLINEQIWHISLPDLKKLEPGNDRYREETHALLLKAKQTLDNIQAVTQESLSNLSCEKIQSIESRLKEKNQLVWKGKTKDGRSVELQLESQESNADITLTFAEMYAIKTAIDVLDIDELIIS